jgi:hypothetical protein
VSYTYVNKYSGSLSPPGFSLNSSYQIKGKETVLFPSVELRYIGAPLGLLVGVSVAVSQPTLELSCESFDFPSPTGVYDRPRGFTTTTKVDPIFNVSGAIEPGIALGNSAMAFLRLSYHQFQARIDTRSSLTGFLLTPKLTSAKTNVTFQGTGLGIGLRFRFSDQVFIQPLAEVVQFADVPAPASTLTSSAEEISVTQTQKVSLRWSAISLSAGVHF